MVNLFDITIIVLVSIMMVLIIIGLVRMKNEPVGKSDEELDVTFFAATGIPLFKEKDD